MDDDHEEEYGNDGDGEDWHVGHDLDMVDGFLHEPVGHRNVYQALLSGQQGWFYC